VITPSKSVGSFSALGTRKFVTEFQNHLGFLIRSPSARKLIHEAIPSTGKRLVIRESPYVSMATPTSPDAGNLNPDGTRGPGSSVTISFDLDPKSAFKVGDESDTITLAMALGHELAHAWYYMSGTAERGPGGRENQAVGLGRYASADFSENRFRGEVGAQPRLTYQQK
jgi:hypothetical protein